MQYAMPSTRPVVVAPLPSIKGTSGILQKEASEGACLVAAHGGVSVLCESAARPTPQLTTPTLRSSPLQYRKVVSRFPPVSRPALHAASWC